jgi:hypothetical protein
MLTQKVRRKRWSKKKGTKVESRDSRMMVKSLLRKQTSPRRAFKSKENPNDHLLRNNPSKVKITKTLRTQGQFVTKDPFKDVKEKMWSMLQ